MYKKILDYLSKKPEPYEKSTAAFWDDPHISKGMLAAHLAADADGASRKYDFIMKSAAWIKERFLKQEGMTLLDLGCGPGLYTELFCKSGFKVTGIDFSKRSIDYAAGRAASENLPVIYHYKNYLEIEYDNEFDLVTLIYCDFGVLSPRDRKTLLLKVRKALKTGGILILDGFTENEAAGFTEGSTTQYCAEGFWAPHPYVCIQNNYYYPETDNYLEQYVIVSEDDCQCYNNWNQVFSPETLKKELEDAGFGKVELYDDVSGKAYTGGGRTICAAAEAVK